MSPCISIARAGMTADMMDTLGSIHPPDGYRNWHLIFYLQSPGEKRKRRVYVTRSPELGVIDSEQMAGKVLERIRGLCAEAPLFEVLAKYTERDLPVNHVVARWKADLLTEMRRRRSSGEIGPDRLIAFEAFERRGYLAFWEGVSIYRITKGSLLKWVGWLRETKPHLSDVSLRHIVRDFGTFVRLLHDQETLRQVPEIPTIALKQKRKLRVPKRVAQLRILEHIPEERRGLWLARALAGLRPAEARKANIAHYHGGELRITAEICKTGDERTLRLDVVAPDVDAWIRKHRSGASPWEPLFPNGWSQSRNPAIARARKHNPDQRWRPTAEWECLAAACDAAGLERIKPNHFGRHAFATHEAQSGTNLIGLQQWMGHQDLRTTRVYVDDFDGDELADLMRPAAPVSIQEARRQRDWS